jgi:hypothetical protein
MKIKHGFLTLLLYFSFFTIFAQKKYLLGIEGSISFINSADYPNGVIGKNKYISTANSLGFGKFISKNTLILFSFNADYYKYIYTYSRDSINAYSDSRQTVSLLPSIGIRQYFSFSEKDIVGLFLEVKGGIGLQIKKTKQSSILNGTSSEEKDTKNNNISRIEITPGAYINLNQNWQIQIKLGGAYYSHSWSKDDNKIINGVLQSTKSTSYQIEFNKYSYSIAIARRL